MSGAEVIVQAGPGLADPLGPATLGEALRLLRHRARMSRDELALAAHVAAGTISNYENDVSSPAAPALRRVAGVLASALDQDLGLLWEQLGELLDRQGDNVQGHAANPGRQRPPS